MQKTLFSRTANSANNSNHRWKSAYKTARAVLERLPRLVQSGLVHNHIKWRSARDLCSQLTRIFELRSSSSLDVTVHKALSNNNQASPQYIWKSYLAIWTCSCPPSQMPAPHWSPYYVGCYLLSTPLAPTPWHDCMGGCVDTVMEGREHKEKKGKTQSDWMDNTNVSDECISINCQHFVNL